MELLLDHGADVNAANRRKSTPLLWALHDVAKVRLLLEHGANVNAKTIDGRTAVYQAAIMANAAAGSAAAAGEGRGCQCQDAQRHDSPDGGCAGRFRSLRLLVERKADVNARNAAGATALMAAAQTGRPEAVRLLLEKGADAKVADQAQRDRPGRSGHRRQRRDCEAPARCRRRSQRTGHPRLFGADVCRRVGRHARRRVKLLLAKGADPECQGRRRNRPHAGGQTRRYAKWRACWACREEERKSWAWPAVETKPRDARLPPPSRRLLRFWRSRATISSASAAAIPAMRRTCPRPPRPSRATADCPRRRRFRSSRTACTH